MPNSVNNEIADKGIVFLAFNNSEIDYQLLVEANAKSIKRFSNISITAITDQPWQSKYVDHFVVGEPGNPTYRRDQILKTDHWLNQNRSLVYDQSPYQKTLLLDSDYFINTSQLLTVFDTDYEFLIGKDFKDVLTGAPCDPKYISNFSIDTVYATALYFKKSMLAEDIFQRVIVIRNNWDYYQTLYQFVSKFRNDFAFAIAMHETNNGMVRKDMYLPHTIWNAMPGSVISFKHDIPWIQDAVMTDAHSVDVATTDIHLLNKKHAQEYARWVLDA
jgi:hypothetical protein